MWLYFYILKIFFISHVFLLLELRTAFGKSVALFKIITTIFTFSNKETTFWKTNIIVINTNKIYINTFCVLSPTWQIQLKCARSDRYPRCLWRWWFLQFLLKCNIIQHVITTSFFFQGVIILLSSTIVMPAATVAVNTTDSVIVAITAATARTIPLLPAVCLWLDERW